MQKQKGWLVEKFVFDFTTILFGTEKCEQIQGRPGNRKHRNIFVWLNERRGNMYGIIN